MAMAAELPDFAQKFVQLWIESLSLALGQVAGAPFPLMPAEVSQERPQPTESDTILTITASGTVSGELVFRVPQPTALIVLQIFMQEEKPPAELTPEGRSGLEEFFRQVAGYVTTSLKPILNEVGLTVGLRDAAGPPSEAVSWIVSAPGAPHAIAIEWQLNPSLIESLRSVPAKENSNASHAAVPPDSASQGQRLGFFMDMELEVTLRFGGRNLLLKEVLELGPGSVLELDREIHDPADLLLDGKLIARGEVVMVDGNYGLRVSEVFNSPLAA